MFKRFLSVIAAILLIANLSACGGKDNTKTPKDDDSAASIPNYEEKDIASSLGLHFAGNRIISDSNDRLLLFDANQKDSSFLMVDKDGNKSNFKAELKDLGSLFTLDSSDNLYMISENRAPQSAGDTSREISYRLNVYSPEAQKLRFLDLGKRTYTNDQPGITDIAVDSKGNLYLLQQRQTIEMYNTEGKKIKDIPAGKIDNIEINDEDQLLEGSFDGGGSSSTIELVDLESGGSLWKTNMEPGNLLTQMKYDRNSKCTYLLCNKGILTCSSDGKLQDYVFDLMQSSLLESGTYIYDFVFDKSKNLYMLAIKSDAQGANPKSLLYKYTLLKGKERAKLKTNNMLAIKSDAQGVNPKPLLYKNTLLKGKESAKLKTLTISVRYSDRFLESAVSAFQKLHPDIRVNVKDYKAAFITSSTGGVSKDENQRAQKAIEDFERINNTEIMAGKGTDIIQVYGLPYQKYVEKDALVNLSKMIKSDKSFNPGKYNQKILDACKYKGKLCFVPLSFSFNLYDANRSLLKNAGIRVNDSKWTWNDFLNLAQKVTRDKNGDGTPDQYALPKASAYEMFEFICGTRLNEFIDVDKKKADFDSKKFINILKLSKEFADKKVCHPQTDAEVLWQMTDPGTVAFMYMYFSGYESLVYQQAIMNGEVDMLNSPSFGGKNIKEFLPGRTFGINSNSKLKKEAWEFIKFLLSDEQQKSQDLYEFPLNTSALNEKAKTFLANMYLYDVFKTQKKRNVKKMTQKDINFVNGWIGNLDTLAYTDSKISRIVKEGADQFFSGRKTAEDAAKMIQSKVATYLGE